LFDAPSISPVSYFHPTPPPSTTRLFISQLHCVVLVLKVGAPYSLKQLGFKEEDIEKVAEIAAKAPYPNPVPLEKEGILHLLRNAWAGNSPSAI
jgi:hypothetical protein